MLTLNDDGSFSYAPNADFNGSDSFSYVTTDDDGGVSNEATVSIAITPVNDAPTFASAGDQTVLEDSGPQSVAGWASGISAGAANEAGQKLSFLIGTDNDALFSALPSIAADGTLTFTSAPDAFGAATVTVQLVDDGGTANGGTDTSAVRTFRIAVTGVNDAPVPQSAEFTIDEDGTLNAALVATDVDSDSLSFAVYLAPGQGALDLSPDGTFTYTPNANYYGEDGFAFTVSDGQVISEYATVVVTINPVNDAPAAQANNYQLLEDKSLSIALRSLGVLGNDSDVDDPQASLTAELVSGTAHGTLHFAANGTFSYTPGADFAGIDTFTYRALDPHGAASDPATVTLSVANVNDPPVAQNGSGTTDEDTPLNGVLVALDIDSTE
ncbi:MAG: tandem-95 repeat protein, partial [Mycobacterium sp.]